MSGPVRGRVPTSQTACGLILVVALAIGLPGLARAGVRGLLFTGETIARHALAHSVVFVDGTRVDLRRVVTAASAHAFGDTDLLIHDLATGRTEIADADVAATAIVSPVESSAATIGELFVNAGDLALFENGPGTPLDPTRARRYLVHRAFEGGAVYLRPGVSTAPEPTTGASLIAGLAGLAGLGLRRRSTRASPRRSDA
ncbi:MAG: PEP-CTERM sorting domain-containing protein [Spirochaetaceae bacterium]|nr:PEP-CTERM sorting domain-containing protein [Myxococcales bacterium]MCB9726412.1 PEP-CTERM sorting domain-containing protein [Spirochaetaceae bacterium]